MRSTNRTVYQTVCNSEEFKRGAVVRSIRANENRLRDPNRWDRVFIERDQATLRRALVKLNALTGREAGDES